MESTCGCDLPRQTLSISSCRPPKRGGMPDGDKPRTVRRCWSEPGGQSCGVQVDAVHVHRGDAWQKDQNPLPTPEPVVAWHSKWTYSTRASEAEGGRDRRGEREAEEERECVWRVCVRERWRMSEREEEVGEEGGSEWAGERGREREKSQHNKTYSYVDGHSLSLFLSLYISPPSPAQRKGENN